LYFYVQSLFYLALPVTYGAARLPSALATLVVLVMVYRLARRWTGSTSASLWAAGLFSISRWLYYPATLARPDILCTMFGLCAIGAVCRWQDTGSKHWLAGSGVCIGLGGLTHPFAIVYALQIAVWLALSARGWRRLTEPLLVAATAIAVFALWVPLILVDPELFAIQFHNQFVRADDGAFSWLMQPAASFEHHLRWQLIFFNWWQCVLVAVPMVVATFAARDRRLKTACHLAWSAYLLLAAVVGTHHTVPGYYAYPAALGFICTGWMIDRIDLALTTHGGRFAIGVRMLTAGALLAAMVPGSGGRLFLAAVRHWGDVNYNSPEFARRLVQAIPSDAVCLVDGEYVLDFVAAGRKTLGVPRVALYLNAEDHRYDYLVLGRSGIYDRAAAKYCGEFQYSEGIAADDIACYAEVFRPSRFPCTHPAEE
jgi:4-amino-4-deoxy-L-arabinose transferase-like glycosyltransferase